MAALGQGVVGAPPVTAYAAAPVAPLTAPTALEDTWGPVQRFERNPWGESMTVDSRGATFVVWASTRTWPHSIKVSRRTVAGRWMDPVTIGRGNNPVIGSDAADTVTVVWERERTNRTTGVWAARKVVGRTWGKPVHLSVDKAAPGYPDGGDVRGASELALAVHPKGATLVAWQWANKTRSKIQSVFRPAQGRWRGVVDLTPAADATAPLVAFGPSGRAWVAYQRTPLEGPTAVKVRDRRINGSWIPTVRVGIGQLGGLGVNRFTEVTVAIRRAGAVRTALWSPVAGWQIPILATPADARVQEWSFASNRHGAAVIVYNRPNGRIDVVRRVGLNNWLAPVTLAAPGSNLFPTAAMNGSGDMLAAWGTYGVYAAYRAHGGGWKASTVRPDTGGVDVLEDMTAQVMPQGDAVLLWEQEARPLRASVLTPS